MTHIQYVPCTRAARGLMRKLTRVDSLALTRDRLGGPGAYDDGESGGSETPPLDEAVLKRDDSLVFARVRLNKELAADQPSTKSDKPCRMTRVDSLALAHKRLGGGGRSVSPAPRERVLMRHDSLTLARQRLHGEPKQPPPKQPHSPKKDRLSSPPTVTETADEEEGPGEADEAVDKRVLRRQSSLDIARRRLSRRSEDDLDVVPDSAQLDVDEEVNERVLRRNDSIVMTRRRLSSQKVEDDDAVADADTQPPQPPRAAAASSCDDDVGLDMGASEETTSSSSPRLRRLSSPSSAQISSPASAEQRALGEEGGEDEDEVPRVVRRSLISRTDSLNLTRRRLSSSEKTGDVVPRSAPLSAADVFKKEKRGGGGDKGIDGCAVM